MNHCPKISIVTPNYNYGHLLEETILSVLNQNYPNLEYIIIDGGSTDNSLEIIKKYESRLAYWTSEKDEGIYDALNKGFKLCTGEIMAYLNSDDIYLPWALETVASVFVSLDNVFWISTLQPGYVDYTSKSRWFNNLAGFSKECFSAGEYAGRFSKYNFIQQESTFWRRTLWEGAQVKFQLDYKKAGDFYLWNEFYKITDLYGLANPLSLFRVHKNQLSSDIDNYIKECLLILQNNSKGNFFEKEIPRRKAAYDGLVIKIADLNSALAHWEINHIKFGFK